MSNENEPIKTFATFVDKAIPMAGLKTPIEAFVGRTRSVIDPIHLLPNPDTPIIPLDRTGRKELSTQLLAKLKEGSIRVAFGERCCRLASLDRRTQ